MQAREYPGYDEKKQGIIPKKIKEMINSKVPFALPLMHEALGHPAVAGINITKVQPGDVVTIEGKLYKVLRINDKGEWITEQLPNPPGEGGK